MIQNWRKVIFLLFFNVILWYTWYVYEGVVSMDDNFFTEKELKSANRGSIAPIVVVIFVIIALLGLAFFGGKYYLASRNNIKIFMNNYFNKLEDNIGKNNSTSGSLSLNVNGDTTDKEKKIFKILPCCWAIAVATDAWTSPAAFSVI